MILLYTRRLSALELLKLLRQNGYHFLLIRFNSGFFPCRGSRTSLPTRNQDLCQRHPERSRFLGGGMISRESSRDNVSKSCEIANQSSATIAFLSIPVVYN